MPKKNAVFRTIKEELNARKAALPHDQQVLLAAAVSTFRQALILGAMMDIDGRRIFLDIVTARLGVFAGQVVVREELDKEGD